MKFKFEGSRLKVTVKNNKFTRFLIKAFSQYALHTYMSLTVFASALAYGYRGDIDKALLFTAISFIISSLSVLHKEEN
ncbi:hypothetical protein ACT7C9_15110 [Bacillus cereus]|uniref:hypothetical protein n=1 Tax=Bacillus cereus TaxID=1396 RepID=UPI000BF34D35|nr:hypothetical protein [Bacillus cereus]PFQ13482.1 hypothetical protein COK14_09010 [Bacillus cereus]